MLERKTSHLQGKVNTEEKEALEKRASDLAEALEEKNKTAATLTTQLKKLQVRVCVSVVTQHSDFSELFSGLKNSCCQYRHTSLIHK